MEIPIARRVAILGSFAALGALGAHGTVGCRARRVPGELRLGYFPNVTHAPALTGVGSGRFARAMLPLRLDARPFNAGPAAMEALLAGELDASFVGPLPVLSAWTAARDRRVHVVSGAASGGVLFVVRVAAGIRRPGDLHGKRLATPQIGNSQDIALRGFLARHGMTSTERGGDVVVYPISGSSILSLFRQGRIDGAWVPEPWASRLVSEAGGRVFLDERDLWPGRAFATTLLAVHSRWLRDDRAGVRRLVRATAHEVAFARSDGTAAKRDSNAQIARLSGTALPEGLMNSAWGRIDFTTDPLVASLQKCARSARELGFLQSDDLRGLVVDRV